MDMTFVHGLHKFSLQTTIDHYRPSMYSGPLYYLYQQQLSCATTTKLRSLKWLIPKAPLLFDGNVYVDNVVVLGLEQEDEGFNYSHGAGTSSPSQKKQVEG